MEKTFVQDFLIEDFEENRDIDFILNAFKNNWGFLVDISRWPEFSLENVKEDLFVENREIKVLVKSGGPIAFTVYRPNKPNKYYFYSDPKSISILYVDPLHRGQGYANILIEYAVSDMVKDGKTKEIFAVINEDNLSSIKTFKKAGFEVVKIELRPGNLPSHIHMSKKTN